VFAALVGATFAAFFVAQNLKSSPAIVKVGKVKRYFSPNGDQRRDRTRISFTLKERDNVTVNVVDAEGNLVRRLETGLAVAPSKRAVVRWDGRDDAGERVPDGRYSLRVDLRREARSVDVRGSSVFVDTTPPRPTVTETDPVITGPDPGPVGFRVRGVSSLRPTRIEVLRTDVEPVRKVAETRMEPGRTRGEWDGLADGQPAKPGTYMIVAKVRDRAGNVGSAPSKLPPQARDVRGQPGVTVRRLAVRAPEKPVRSGEVVRFAVDARNRPYRWSLRRVGQGRLTKEGRSSNFALAMHAPDDGSGLYLLEVRAGRDRATAPVLVQSGKRADILVVVPAITWMGEAKVDDGPGFDGIPNTLPTGGPVAWPRVLLGLPDGLADEVAPLLVALDRSNIRYDVTTDLALTRSRDPRPTDREAVLLAGSHRWVERGLARRLRRYVSAGGRVASFGVESLRAGVTVAEPSPGRGSLQRPTPMTPVDAFGHRLEPVRRASQPGPDEPPLQLDVLDGAGSGLLEGSDGVLEGFSVFEEAQSAPDGPLEIVAGVGQNPTDAEVAEAETQGRLPREALPVLSESRLGDGIVIRVGLPEWASRIGEDAEVSQITRNVFDILRGVQPRLREPL
jgi:hypothetical protein